MGPASAGSPEPKRSAWKMKKAPFGAFFVALQSSGRGYRTHDRADMSRLLYHLSYPAKNVEFIPRAARLGQGRESRGPDAAWLGFQRASRASTISSAWLTGLTLGHIFAIRPSASIR